MQDLRKVRTCVKAAMRNLPDHPVNAATWLKKIIGVYDDFPNVYRMTNIIKFGTYHFFNYVQKLLDIPQCGEYYACYS
jgi:hypothetical protein